MLWAEPAGGKIDIELGVYEVEGEGDVQIRHAIKSKLYEGLLEATKKQPYWIVFPDEQRRRIRKIEDELECTEDCALPISTQMGLDMVVLGRFSSKKNTEGVLHYYLTLELYKLPEKKLISSISFDETQALGLQEKMMLAAQRLLFPKPEESSEKTDEITELPTETPALDKEIEGFAEDSSEKAEVPKEPMYLNVDTSPTGALVLLNGTLLCRETPCSVNVPQGAYSLSIQNESYVTYEKELNLAEDRSLNITLTPTFSELSIMGPKSLAVFLDGKKFGTIPLFGKKIEEGTHTVTINDVCYVRSDEILEVRRGEKYNLELETIQRLVPIDIKVQDSFSKDYNAELWIDDVLIGTAPFSGFVPLCARSLKTVLVRGEENVSERLELDLDPKKNEIIISVPDFLEGGKRSVPFDWSFFIDLPLWYGGIGYRESTHSASESPRFQLGSGYIQPTSGGFDGGIYEYSIPADLFLNETEVGGVGLSLAVNSNHLFGRLDFDYGVSGELYFFAPEGNGFPVMVYSPDIANFSFSAGLMPMIPFFRPFVGARVQGGVYTMDLLEVDSDSEFLSTYPLTPYYLVSTDYNEEGAPVRPKLQLGHLAVGPTFGGLLYFSGDDFLLGIEMQYSYLFSTMGTIRQMDTTLVFGNRF